MKRWQRGTVLGALGLATVVALNPAGAFVLSPGRPSDNVSSAGLRAPGLMVNAGIGRHSERLDDFQGENEITATQETPGLVDLFLPEWIEIIFEQLNDSLDLLISALFVRAGETPPALSQLTGTTTPPPTKVKEPTRGSLVDRSMGRIGTAAR